MDELVHFRRNLSACVVLLARTLVLPVIACGSTPPSEVTDAPIAASPSNSPSMTTGENAEINTAVPKVALDPILNEAAKLANVPREQLIIVRAQAVVWNDGSLGCPEPGMQYTQALINGYWVVIRAPEHTYDFRTIGRIYEPVFSCGVFYR